MFVFFCLFFSGSRMRQYRVFCSLLFYGTSFELTQRKAKYQLNENAASTQQFCCDHHHSTVVCCLNAPHSALLTPAHGWYTQWYEFAVIVHTPLIIVGCFPTITPFAPESICLLHVVVFVCFDTVKKIWERQTVI